MIVEEHQYHHPHQASLVRLVVYETPGGYQPRGGHAG